MGLPMRLIAALGMLVGLAGVVLADEPPSSSGDREIPAPFAPFESMIGSWKGTGYYLANRIRGWQETHAWAWKFEKGAITGVSVELKGNKLVDKGIITFDENSNTYTLAGTDPAGAKITLTGKLDKSGKGLELSRVGKTAEGSKQNIAITPNGNLIRYTLKVSEQEAGAPQYKPTLEAGLTKEGESFAAGSSAGDLPKCIITGGASTLSVAYQGKSYPLCCTGCRDEFNDNPEKYIKRLAASADAAGKAGVMKATVTKPVAEEDTAKPTKPDDAKSKDSDEKLVVVDEKKAQTLLKMGQNLEKAKKTKPALGYYRQILKDFAKSSAAKTAEERVKALEAR